MAPGFEAGAAVPSPRVRPVPLQAPWPGLREPGQRRARGRPHRPDDHPDRVLVTHLFVAPGGRVVTAHRHSGLTERFHVLAGRVGFLIGEEERELGPGEAAEVPPETVHDWWQVGEETAEVIVEVTPGQRFVEVVGMRAYRETIEIASPPPFVQALIFIPLAALGRARGLRPTYEKYLSSEVVVEPDPRALALLTDDGRLRFDPA